MKAITSLPSNVKAETSNAPTKMRFTQLDGIYRSLRILQGEITELENIVSILKRDVARIDRKQYREMAESPLVPTIPHQETKNEIDPAASMWQGVIKCQDSGV